MDHVDRQTLASVVDAKRKDDPYQIFRWSLVSPQHKYLWNISPKVACVTTTITLREFERNPYRGGEMWTKAGSGPPKSRISKGLVRVAPETPLLLEKVLCAEKHGPTPYIFISRTSRTSRTKPIYMRVSRGPTS